MSSNISEWVDGLTKDKVSFILPTIAGRKYHLSHNVESIVRIFEETFNDIDYEIIIVYDGCERTLEKDYSRDKVKEIFLKEKSGCVSLPRNIGLSYATGDIIAPTDDDVHILYRKHKMIKSLINLRKEKSNIKLIYGIRNEFTFDGDEYWYNPLSIHFASFLNNKTAVGIDNGQFVYLADVYKKINPVFAINACDWETYSRIGEHYDFCYYDDVVVNYIWDNTGVSTNISKTPKNQRVDPLKILPKYIEYFCKNGFTKTVIDLYLENQ